MDVHKFKDLNLSCVGTCAGRICSFYVKGIILYCDILFSDIMAVKLFLLCCLLLTTELLMSSSVAAPVNINQPWEQDVSPINWRAEKRGRNDDKETSSNLHVRRQKGMPRDD